MKPVVTAGEMKELDRNTIESARVPGMVLMERAALKTVEAMEKYLGNKDRVLVVCGNGNNGGDGMAIARLLHLKGIKVGIYLAGQEEKLTDQPGSSCRSPNIIRYLWSITCSRMNILL